MEISLNNLAEALFEVIASFWVESWVEADLNMHAIFKDSLHNLSNSTCCEAYNYLRVLRFKMSLQWGLYL